MVSKKNRNAMSKTYDKAFKNDTSNTPANTVEKEEPVKKEEENKTDNMDKKPEISTQKTSGLQLDVDNAPDADGLKAEATDVTIGVRKGGMVGAVPEGTFIDGTASMVMVVPDMPIEFRPVNSFVTLLMTELTPIMKRLRLKFSKTVGDISTEARTDKAFGDFYREIVAYYDGVRIGIETELKPILQDRKITKESSAGFNFRGTMNLLSNFNYKTWFDSYARIPGVDKVKRKSTLQITNPANRTDEWFEAHSYYGMPDEFKLMMEYHRLGLEKVTELNEIRPLFELLAGKFHYLAPPKDSYINIWEKIYIDNRFVAYGHIIRNNDFMHLEMFDIVRSKVRSSFSVTVEQTNTAIASLSIAARQSRGKSAKFNEVPGAMSGEKAMEALVAMTSIALMNEIVRIETNFPLDDFSPVQVIEALLWKLMVPGLWTNRDTQVAVDNYLAEWFVRFLPGMTRRQRALWVRVPVAERKNGTINYLDYNRALIPIWASSFLLNGEWNMGVKQNIVPEVFTSSVSGMMGRYVHYFPWSGRRPMDWTDRWMQLDAFINFIDEMQRVQSTSAPTDRGTFPGDNGGHDFDSMIRTLREVSLMESRLTDFAYYYNRALQQLSVTPLAMISEISFIDSIKTARVGIPMGSLFSIVMLLDAETITVADFGKDFYRYGRNIIQAFNLLTENYYYSIDYMPKSQDKPFYTKTEILENALSLTPTSPVNDLMRTKFGSKPNSHDVNWPSRSVFGYDATVFKRKLDLARDFVQRNLSMFSIATSFYYAPYQAASTKFDDVLQQYYFLPDDIASKPTKEYNWNELVTLYQKEQIAGILRNARRNREVLKFNIMVKTSFEHGFPKPNEQISPIKYARDAISPVTIGTVPIYFRDEEEFYDREKNITANIEEPDWLIAESEVPRIFRAEHAPNNLIHTGFDVLLDGYKIIDEVDQMLFVARNL